MCLCPLGLLLLAPEKKYIVFRGRVERQQQRYPSALLAEALSRLLQRIITTLEDLTGQQRRGSQAVRG